MKPEVQLLPGAIAEILASASETGTLSLSDRYGLMAAVLDDSLSEEEQRTLNRILHSVRRGRVKVAT
ncbi:MAG: hypothetical protein F6K03_13090 [Kamptonema sp. SIO4C4]|nr:hypothetical protein [Kamptonema sp. SIO4C4]